MQLRFFVLFCFCVLLAKSVPLTSGPPSSDTNADVDPLAHATMCELIQHYPRYPCERHDVTTEDGYVLGVFRMRNPGKPVIVLQHGFVDSSTTWVMNSPDQSLGYLAFDQGYDVWFGNSRGNGYSMGATFCTDCGKSERFWNFTWDDMATYDMPAVIDYVLQETGNSQLVWVGHSQGTTQAFALLSRSASIASKISAFVALAPVGYIAHPQGVVLSSLSHLKASWVAKVLGDGVFPPANNWLALLFPHICELTPNLCANTIFSLVGGGDSNQLNRTRLPIYTGHTPSTTSVENMIHWVQEMNSDKFESFDFGSAEKNEAAYGQPTPPPYEVKNINIPVGIFYGDKDDLADPEDVSRLIKELPSQNVKVYHYSMLNHMDFVWGWNVTSLVYEPVFEFIQSTRVQK